MVVIIGKELLIGLIVDRKLTRFKKTKKKISVAKAVV
jgi:hypothetical protein